MKSIARHALIQNVM